MQIETFEHRTGVHGGSAALRNLLGWAGVDLSEPMVFGLGAGLGFHYTADQGTPTRRLFGRSPTFEEDVVRMLDLALHPIDASSDEQGWAAIVDSIDRGQPLLVRCDASPLPYLEADMPFDVRCVVVMGVDAANGRVCLSDGAVDEPQWLDRDRWMAAWSPGQAGGAAWRLEPGETRPLPEAIRRALHRNREAMTESGDETRGLAAASRFREEIGRWRDAADAASCYRAAYRAIEHRETGGAHFRNLYRDFLNEAAEVAPALGRLQLGLSMGRTADAWSTLGTYLAAMATYVETDGDEPGEDPSHHVESMAEAAYQFESTFWNRVEALDV